MTPKLWERLEGLAVRAKAFDIRRGYDKQEIADYDKLVKFGYCDASENGPGGTFLDYKITEKGKQALANRNS
jgi:hypothetical protein